MLTLIATTPATALAVISKFLSVRQSDQWRFPTEDFAADTETVQEDGERLQSMRGTNSPYKQLMRHE